MLTFFTTAKPFQGHSGIIQRNALKSWTFLHPDVEVILFGDEEGAAEVCAEYGLRHEPHVERHESGMKYLDYIFERAQKIARHNYLCYSNCDIILMKDFLTAFERVAAWRENFLLVGQRWDTDITWPLDFSAADWDANVRGLAKTKGVQQIPHFVDYFAFRRGLYDKVPPLLIGRSFWDWWLVWKAYSQDVPIVDCSPFVVAIHQNHGYAYHPQGKQGTHEDLLAQRNIALAGNGKHLRFTIDSTHQVDRFSRIRRTPLHRFFYQSKTLFRTGIQKVINVTYPIRRVLGLRRSNWQLNRDKNSTR